MAEDIVGSNMPDLNGYGQNRYPGPSSTVKPGDTQGQSKFLPGVSSADLDDALGKVNPKDARDTVRDAAGKGNPPAPKDFKQPKFAAPQTREVSSESYPLAHGMDSRSDRNR